MLAVHGEGLDAGKELKALLAPINSISAEFRQQLYSADDYLIQDGSGRMRLATPGKMRWLLDSPMEQWLISDGETLWLYDPDLEQVIIKPFDPDVAAVPALILSGSVDDLSAAYEISLSSTSDLTPASEQSQSFTLTPRDQQTFYEYLRFDFEDNKPAALTIVDALGQRTQIVFSLVVLNEEIAPELFTFEVPPGVDVIRDE